MQKHTPNTKIHIHICFCLFSRIHLLQKLDTHSNHRFPLIFMARLWRGLKFQYHIYIQYKYIYILLYLLFLIDFIWGIRSFRFYQSAIFGTILGPLQVHFRTPYANKLCLSTQNQFCLKWHILTSSPLFDRHHRSPNPKLNISEVCFRNFHFFKLEMFKNIQTLLLTFEVIFIFSYVLFYFIYFICY